MVSLPPSGNGHKPFSTNHTHSPKERHQLSLTELAFGRNLGQARARVKRLEAQLEKLHQKLADALDVLQVLQDPGGPGEKDPNKLSPGPPGPWESRRDARQRDSGLGGQQALLDTGGPGVLGSKAEGISITLGSSSLRKGEEKKEEPTFGGSSSRVRARSHHTRTRTPVQEQDMAPGFLRFWSCYQRRVAKQEAYQAWTDLKPNAALEDQIVDAAKRQFETNFKDTELSKIPHPATWLRAARWEDEIFDLEARAHEAYERLCREKDEAIRESQQRKSAAMGRKAIPGQQGL